jgi:acetate kinase
VFSGTVGERSFKMRERILSSLEGLGFILDKNKNNATDNIDAVISTQESKIKIKVVKTDEMTQIARETREFTI